MTDYYYYFYYNMTWLHDLLFSNKHIIMLTQRYFTSVGLYVNVQM